MTFLRSVYISVFVGYIFAVFIYALVELFRGMDPLWSWLGMALAASGPVAFFIWVFLAKPARTSQHPLGVSLVCGFGLAITMTMSWRFGDAAGIVHIWTGLVFVCWIIYLRWYAHFANRDSAALTKGNMLPEFSLLNVEGETVNSKSFTGKSHILLFYRGNWCPFCVAQVRELAKQYREIETAGAAVALISSQPLNYSRSLAKRFNVPMNFYRDPENQAAKRLGIDNAWGIPMGAQLLGYDSDTALPTVIITDPSGKIIYSHQTDNYRIRPEPAEFLAVLSQE